MTIRGDHSWDNTEKRCVGRMNMTNGKERCLSELTRKQRWKDAHPKESEMLPLQRSDLKKRER